VGELVGERVVSSEQRAVRRRERAERRNERRKCNISIQLTGNNNLDRHNSLCCAQSWGRAERAAEAAGELCGGRDSERERIGRFWTSSERAFRASFLGKHFQQAF